MYEYDSYGVLSIYLGINTVFYTSEVGRIDAPIIIVYLHKARPRVSLLHM